MNTVLFLLLNGLMVLSSLAAAYRYFKESPFSQLIVAAFVLFTSQVTVSILFLGIVVKSLSFVFIILFNAIISSAVLWFFRRGTVPAVLHSFRKVRGFSSGLLRSKDIFLYLMLLIFGAQVVWILVKIYVLPPHVWDSFAYHLHPVAEWYQQGMIPGFIDSPVVRMNRNPLGSKVFHFWSFYLTRDITWLELPQFFYGLFTMVSAYVLMIKMEIKRFIALRYALLIYFIPLILIQSRTCQDHLTLTGATMITLVFFIEFFYRKTQSSLFFFSLSAGILLGIKISSPQIIATLFAAMILQTGFRHFRAGPAVLRRAWPVITGAGIILLLGGYWYIKNPLVLHIYITKFNALFSWKVLAAVLAAVSLIYIYRKFITKPRQRRILLSGFLAVLFAAAAFLIISHWPIFKSSIIGSEDIYPQLKEQVFYDQHPIIEALKCDFVKNLLIFSYRIKDIGYYYPYTPDFIHQSGFGIQFFGFGLIAYFLFAGRLYFRASERKQPVTYLFLFSIVLLCGYFVYYYSAVNYRMFMFFPVIGLILWAFIVEKLKFRFWAQRFLDGLIIVMMLFSAASCLFDGNLTAKRWKTLFTIDAPDARTSAKYSDLFKRYEEWSFIETYIPNSEPIAYHSYYDSWVFPYFDTKLKRKIYHLPSIPGFSLHGVKKNTYRLKMTPRFIQNLKKRGIRYIHINPHGYRHKKKQYRRIILWGPRVLKVSPHLYYIRWQNSKK